MTSGLTRSAEEKYPEVDSFVMVNVKQVGPPGHATATSPKPSSSSSTVADGWFHRSPTWEHTSSFSNTTTCLFTRPMRRASPRRLTTLQRWHDLAL